MHALASFVTAMTAFGLQAPAPTPYRQDLEPQIQAVRVLTERATRFAPVEIEVELTGRFNNPFDPAEIALDAEVTSPTGRTHSIPGYLHRDFTRSLVDGREVLTPAGPTEWRIRWCPREVGEYRVAVTLRNAGKTLVASAQTIRVANTASPGFIRVSPRDRRYFEFQNGQPYFPIGANVCWGGDAGTHSYDTWLPKYGAVGANFMRLWLSPLWTTFALEQPGRPEEGKGMGQMDLGNAWRLDYVLALARRHGIRTMLCIDSFNILQAGQIHSNWNITPHNFERGGPLRSWRDFWTLPEMQRLYRNKLRYLVARYAADTHVFAWEFWNEVDLVSDFNEDQAREWHVRMATVLRGLDPYDHLITTSFARTQGIRSIDTLEEIDFVQSHHYGSSDLGRTVSLEHSRKNTYGKPHFFGEIGADWRGPRADDDPNGLQIHEPLWVSAAIGAAGAAAPWWWDNLIEPKNRYELFGNLVRFVRGIDWPAEGFRQVNPVISWVTRPERPVLRDITLDNLPVSWDPSPVNQPRSVRVRESGTQGLPIAGILHGTVNHADKHNPVQFTIDLPRPIRFEVVVSNVSGHGGAGLAITVNGRQVSNRRFEDPDGTTRTEDITRFNGAYFVNLPRGRNVVVVRNPGPDWVMVSYRLVGALASRTPPVVAWAVAGNRTAMAYVRHEDASWGNRIALKRSIPAVPPVALTWKGLSAGEWKVEVWDTWKGQVVSTRRIRVGNDGSLRTTLPKLQSEIALKATIQR